MTIGVELATAATTRRGLYVAVTRGEQENLILVVTNDRDLDQARDILEGVLASDRADIPAITQRRELADTDRVSRPGFDAVLIPWLEGCGDRRLLSWHVHRSTRPSSVVELSRKSWIGSGR